MACRFKADYGTTSKSEDFWNRGWERYEQGEEEGAEQGEGGTEEGESRGLSGDTAEGERLGRTQSGHGDGQVDGQHEKQSDSAGGEDGVRAGGLFPETEQERAAQADDQSLAKVLLQRLFVDDDQEPINEEEARDKRDLEESAKKVMAMLGDPVK
jgi:hypothetical protein